MLGAILALTLAAQPTPPAKEGWNVVLTPAIVVDSGGESSPALSSDDPKETDLLDETPGPESKSKAETPKVAKTPAAGEARVSLSSARVYKKKHHTSNH